MSVSMNTIARLALATSALALLAACAIKPPPNPNYVGRFGDVANTNPDILAAHEQAYQAEQQEIIVAADMYPTLSLTAGASASTAADYTLNGASTELDVGLGLNWSLIKAVGAVTGLQAAQESTRAARAALLAEENTVLVDIVSAIADYDRARTIVALRSQTLARLQQSLAAQQARFEAGEVAETEVLQVRSRVSASQLALAQARLGLEQAKHELSALGLATDHGVRLASPAGFMPQTEEEAVRVARDSNATLQQANHELTAAETNLSGAWAELGPDLNLSANVNQSATYFTDNTSDVAGGATIRLSLSVPIFDGGRRAAELSVQQSQVRELAYRTQSASTSVENKVRQLWQAFRTSLTSANYALQRVQFAKHSLEGIREAIKVGARAATDELAALDEVAEAEIALADAHYEQLVVGHQLLAELGRIGKAYNLSPDS